MISLILSRQKNKIKTKTIASGIINLKQATLIALITLLSFVYFFLYSDQSVLLLVVLYFIINLFYSAIIKKIKYLDLIAVSSDLLLEFTLVHLYLI